MDLLTLDREATSHLHFLSVIDDRLAGGVLTSFPKKFAEEHFESVFAYPVVEGRVIRVRADGKAGSLDIFNVHLDPNLGIIEAREVLRKITNCMERDMNTVTMIIGDLNTPMEGDPKMYLKDDSLQFTYSKYGKAVDEEFHMFTDIAGDYFSHRATLHDGNIVLSKIDRCLIDLQPVDLHDRHCSAKALSNVLDEGFCSDHAPISFTARPATKKRNLMKAIPQWLAEHAVFKVHAKKMMDEFQELRDQELHHDLKDCEEEARHETSRLL